MPSQPSLDVVSPLPPVRSGIADYTVDLLPHLAERADVRVLALPGQPVAPEVERRWRPVPLEDVPAAEAAAGGRVPLYQMGNNRYHEAVYRRALEVPGILTLHDMVLHHLISELHLGERDFAAYRRRLEEDHGWLGREAARPREWGGRVEAALFALPVHRHLLVRQRGVLVHDEWAARAIRAELPELRLAVVPMGVPLPPPADPEAGREFRRRRGLPADAPLLGSFGFQTPIKRTDRVVEALAAPTLAGVHLVVVGQPPGAVGGLAERAAELGVGDRVHELGFVDFSEFEAAIAACDLCLNLRYPTAGETSASLLRVLAVGRPAVVSDYAQFAELPDDVVVKVPLGDDEVPALARRLGRLLEDRERLAAMGEAARAHVARRHDPAAAAAAVVEACIAWGGLEPPEVPDGPGADERGPDAATSLAWSRLDARLSVSGHETPWPSGTRRRLEITLTNAGPARLLAADRGPGGVAVAWRLDEDGAGPHAEAPWLGLPRDLAPGESHRFTLELRRPPAAARLRLVPHVVGGHRPAGPTWEEPLS